MTETTTVFSPGDLIAELQSGKYIQGFDSLRNDYTGPEGGDVGYCCLGVACKMIGIEDEHIDAYTDPVEPLLDYYDRNEGDATIAVDNHNIAARFLRAFPWMAPMEFREIVDNATCDEEIRQALIDRYKDSTEFQMEANLFTTLIRANDAMSDLYDPDVESADREYVPTPYSQPIEVLKKYIARTERGGQV